MHHDAFDNDGLPRRRSGVDPAIEGPGILARLMLWLVLAVVATHVAAVALWVAPDNLLREKIGVTRLSNYILPMFNQSWSVFAPEADFGYELIQIRAELRGPGATTTTTDWIKVTARELAPAVRYHPFPSRTAVMSDRMAGDLLQDFNVLTPAQQQLVGGSGSTIPTAVLGSRLASAATNDVERARAAGFISVETALEYFLSGIAHAVWGDRVEALQFRRSQITVSQYGGGGSRQVESGYGYYSNWRPLHALSAADRSAFQGYADQWGIR